MSILGLDIQLFFILSTLSSHESLYSLPFIAESFFDQS